MFAINLRRIYYICDKVIVRNLRSRRIDHRGPNPGLDNRINAFREERLPIEDNDAEEFIEQSETDFYKVGDVYSEHLNETLIGKHELKHQIIKEKYFKENMPNLLTWSEKEQIRHLVSTSPEEWTPERIAESFPVTVPVVKKLLKYPWKPTTEERIARHDASAMRNWRELREGSLDIPKELQEQFLRFSDRKIPPLNKKSLKKDVTFDKVGEYEQIVHRCANKDNKEQELQLKDKSDCNKNTKLAKAYEKRITLEELTTKIKSRIDKGSNVEPPDQLMVNTVRSLAETTTELKQEIELQSPEEVAVKTYKKQENEKDVMNYPERIRIPKSAYKKGATFKVNDCFYDHDGKFLYRVLGMTKSVV